MRLSLPPLAALSLVLSLLLCSPASAHFDPHPLSYIRLDNIQKQLDGGVIRIHASALRGMGETVNISYSGLSSHYPGAKDWVGVWSPAPVDGNYSRVSPSKYKFVTPDATGAGEVALWLLNMREDVVVAYFTGGLHAPVMLAESEVVRFDNPALPMHLHLALTGDPTQMRVDWTSAQDSGLWVRWGSHPTNLTHTLKAVSTSTYTASDMCGAPATTVGFRSPGFLHTALITGLTPHTHYWYQVGASSPQSESRVFDFYAAPAPDASDVEFAIFGDLGQVETDGSNEASEMDGSILTTRALAADVEQGRVNLSASTAVFHIGDISYARGYVTIWEQFFHQISAFQPRLPWMTIDGNHERDWAASGSIFNGTDSGGECGVAIAQRFHMPTPTTTGRAVDHTWWSIDFGPVHFTVISTELQFNRSSEQLRWVAQDWAQVDRTKTPFLILAGHRPMYIDSTYDAPMGGDLPVSRQLIESLEPLMQRYQVDFAFWGHHHSVQRTCPVHNSTCVERSHGTIHIVTGAAGAGFSQNLQPTPPQWIRFVNDSTHGYIVAHVHNRQSMRLDFIDAQHRTIMDTITIERHALPAASGVQTE